MESRRKIGIDCRQNCSIDEQMAATKKVSHKDHNGYKETTLLLGFLRFVV